VESALKKLIDVIDAVVFGEDDKEWGQSVSAAVIIKPGSSINDKIIYKELRDIIASFKIPKKIYFVDSFPTSPLGKIKKQELIEQLKGV